MRVGIVGGGIMGLCSAWALARAGHAVSVYEQGSIPNPIGSSYDQHRLIRYPYGDQRGYARMVAQAYPAWEELFRDLGQRLYAATGTLVLTSGDGEWARASAAAVEELGQTVHWLGQAELESRVPFLVGREEERAFLLESGGVLLASRIVDALAARLPALGVVLRPQTRVLEIDAQRARLALADGAADEADLLIVAAGAWAPRLLPSLRGRITPSRQVVVYLEPPPELAAAWARAPMLLDIDPEAGFYAIPPVPSTLLKLGDHRFRLTGDPDQERSVANAEAFALFSSFAPRLRDAERYRIVGSRACFYSVEAQERFVVETLDRCVVVSACSGHGFKFAPALAAALRETLAGQRTPAELARWAAGEL